ncbi:MAG: metal-dependent hydrolase [Acidobacteriota bacterium]|nr:metal-dependent hydrolase [Acidobacteriota bacterium]
MPSPIGHALGGMAVGALISGRPGWRIAAACAVAATLPDLDFLLPLQHRGPTHSIGATALVFAGAAGMLSLHPGQAERRRTAVAVALAYASHVLLDWLGADSSTPRGVLALWPVSDVFYVSGLDVFNAVDRRYWTQGFWTRNALALARELVILGPVAAICASAGRRVRSYQPRGATPPPA